MKELFFRLTYNENFDNFNSKANGFKNDVEHELSKIYESV